MIRHRLLCCLVLVEGLWPGEHLEWGTIVPAVFRDVEAGSQCQHDMQKLGELDTYHMGVLGRAVGSLIRIFNSGSMGRDV